jgi:hypothetical protein
VPGAGTATAQLAALTKLQPKGFAMISEQQMRMDMFGNETVMSCAFRVTEFARGGVQAADRKVADGFPMIHTCAMMQQLINAANGAHPPSAPGKF